jgi:site-specific recombinase XerD
MNGGELYALKELLGHGQISTTLIYAHLSGSHLEGEANKVRF